MPSARKQVLEDQGRNGWTRYGSRNRPTGTKPCNLWWWFKY